MAINFGGYDYRTMSHNPLYQWERELRDGMRQTNQFGCARHPGEARSREEHEYLIGCSYNYSNEEPKKAVPAAPATKKSSNLLLLLEN